MKQNNEQNKPKENKFHFIKVLNSKETKNPKKSRERGKTTRNRTKKQK